MSSSSAAAAEPEPLVETPGARAARVAGALYETRQRDALGRRALVLDVGAIGNCCTLRRRCCSDCICSTRRADGAGLEPEDVARAILLAAHAWHIGDEPFSAVLRWALLLSSFSSFSFQRALLIP